MPKKPTTAEANRIWRSLPLGAPLHRFVVSSGFGPRLDPFNRRRAVHQGLDLIAPRGTRVRATAPGVVTVARRAGAYGRLVEIDHGNGVRTRYAHLRSIAVKVGQKVGKGRVIGALGSSGRSSGPHLHYEVLVSGVARNPLRFILAPARLEAKPAPPAHPIASR